VTAFADLHIHTNFSDSTASPAQVVAQALANELAAIAITDHDTVEGLPAARVAAQNKNLEIIPGVELSTEIHDEEIHILGYCFDDSDPGLIRRLTEFQVVRVHRVKEIIRKLAEQGIGNILLEEVLGMTCSQSVGRPHLACLLVEKGWVSNMREAFDRYLGEGCPAYVAKFKQTPYEAIDFIRSVGGVAVLAHPMVNSKDELIPSFVEAGLGGLEVYYPNCSNTVKEYYEGIAKKHGLVMTGGSDAHGERRRDAPIGKAHVPYEYVQQLKDRAGH
jgi:3',5'-nucleoside bisphosphate phosphatase